MKRRTELVLVLLVDAFCINLSFAAFFFLRFESGMLTAGVDPEFLLPMGVLYIYWLILFSFSGLYRTWYTQSRIDELLLLFRTTFFGALILFFLVFMDDIQTGSDTNYRLVILFYWGSLLVGTAFGRMVLRSIQKRILGAGLSGNRTLIIGSPDAAQELILQLQKTPALGYRVIGSISLEGLTTVPLGGTVPHLGSLVNIGDVIREKDIQEVLIALAPTEHERLLEIIRICSEFPVGIKIKPDLYNIVSGQARISSIHGTTLMDIRPEIMKPWERILKRAIDIGFSSMVLAIGAPLWLLIALATRIESRGPALYRQDRVGRDKKIFNIYKFRSMVSDAEKLSGPVWAGKNDPRVTGMGKILRKTHMDEIPQFINVLKGDMSLVGPRPERPYFVDQFSKEIPLYTHRLRVRPGITGWAQIKHTYDQSIEDVKTKLEYDLFYIENLSWRLDLVIILNTAYRVLTGKGHT